MRVGVEEPEVEDLRRVVVEHLRADFLEVVARRDQAIRVSDRDALDVFHDKHVLAAQIGIHLRAADERHVLVQPGELGEVLGLAAEVGFLQERRPHLFHDGAQIEHLVALHVAHGVAGEHAHDVDVERHRSLHARALDLDGDHVPVAHDRAVHLRERCAAERAGVDGLEQLVAPAAEFRVERRDDLLERQRIAFRLQLGELVAERLREDFRTRGKRLPDLHEARAQVLERGAELFGREPARRLVLPKKGKDFAHAAATGLRIEPEAALGVGVGPGREEMA